MTGAEREDFRELRAEMRESFTAVIDKLDSLDRRVISLEETRAVDSALVVERRRLGEAHWARTIAIASMCAASIVAFVQLVNFLFTRTP